MENRNENHVNALNKLVEINNDRVEGYERAADETDDNTLKPMFLEMSSQSRQFASQLGILIRELGGEPKEGTTSSGKLYRVWMDIKAALAGKDKKAIVSSCEYGEDVAKGAYKDFFEDDDAKDISERVRTIVQSQYTEIKKAHDQVRAMRDTLVS
jgi:uncharacterized protein (TIGR02284 family)